MSWFSLALRRYAAFSGRSQRAEFWYFVLFAVAIELGLFMLDKAMAWTYSDGDLGYLSSVASMVLLLPSLSVSARRLHDIGKSGWWQLLAFVPVVGLLVLIYAWSVKGQGGSNPYGTNPLEIHIA